MKKRVTIKDIAIEAGVSTGTVHRAIYGKKGVGEEVQKRIIDLCLKHGYRINTVASALKRGNLRIVAAFPAPEGKNRFFYSSVWQGFRRCMAELHDYNIEIVELPYYPGTEHDQSEVLFSCYKNYQGEIDALITIGRFDSLCTRVIQTYHEHNIPIFLACDDMINCKRIACVQADYTMTGRIVAELLSSQLPKNSTVLICASNRSTPSHYQTVEGFEDYIAQNAIPLHVLKIYGYENERELSIRLFEELDTRTGIAGAFSVSARLSILLANEVRDLGKQNEIRVIASDLFPETIQNMELGIVKNIIYKNPEKQAYRAAQLMSNYVLKSQKPPCEVEYVESHVIFRSSLDMYRKYGENLLETTDP